MEIVGYGFIIGCIIGLALYFWDEHRKDEIYDNGYYAGRAAGWRASKIIKKNCERLKSRAVFDYDKQN
jgi:hypothetical protein